MDPSALIFVALAVAWAAYLIPKALEHHDAGARARSVTTFSERIRILARREAISRRATALVRSKAAVSATGTQTETVPVAPSLPDTEVTERPLRVIVEEVLIEHQDSVLETTQSGRLHLREAGPQSPRRTASAVAAQRRRRVLWSLVFLTAAVGATAAGSLISWLWLLVPLALVVAWLVACRLMVTKERAARRNPSLVTSKPAFGHVETRTSAEIVPEVEVVAALTDDDTTNIPAIPADGTWAPVNAPLPTYVSKPAARRSITTIDLDSTGVWTSGRTDADSAIAREADAARLAPDAEQQRRASGA